MTAGTLPARASEIRFLRVIDERIHTQVAKELRPLAEECQLTMDLWLAEGRKAVAGSGGFDDAERARRRMEDAIEAYRTAIEASLRAGIRARSEPILT